MKSIMKKIVTTILFALVAVITFAQASNATALKFLGFPVDGTKQQMIENLKSRGFSYNTFDDYLTGQFNGEYVQVLIHTNHSIVDRIVVVFPSTSSKSEIKNRFNRLLRQFENNDKYFAFEKNEPIPMNEDIAYELTVNDKLYQAGFYYVGDTPFEQTINNLCELVTSMLPEEQAASIVSDVNTFMETPTHENVWIFEHLTELLLNAEWTPEKVAQFSSIANAVSSVYNSFVWFSIDNQGIDYNIDLFYDNRANMANGEDL